MALKRGEARYLGYSLGDVEITNDRFPYDYSPTAPLNEKKWIINDPDMTSWRDLKDEQKEQIRNSTYRNKTLYPTPCVFNQRNTDGTPIVFNMSMNQILSYSQNGKGTNAITLDEQKKRMIVQCPPTMSFEGSIKLNTKNMHYETVQIPKLDYIFARTLSISANDAVIEADKESVDIQVTVTANLSMIPPPGITMGDILRTDNNQSQISLLFMNTKKYVQVTNPKYTFTFTVKRSDLHPDYNGKTKITLSANSEIGTIYNDLFVLSASKDIYVTSMSSSPYVNLVLGLNPEQKEITGEKDETLLLTATATLMNYTSSVNIKAWKIESQMTDDSSSILSTLLTGARLGTSKTFTFIISKSKLDTLRWTQFLKCTATVEFNNEIHLSGGATAKSCSTTAYSSAEFYKNKPRGEVTALIDCPDTIKQGLNLAQSASRSTSSIGAALTSYSWTYNREINEARTGVTTNVTFMNTGTVDITLNVTDEYGNTGSCTKTVEVLAVQPVVSIGIEGNLKENRKVTISNQTKASPPFAVSQSQTVFTVTALSGGTSGDIKYTGSLNGVSSKDILFKKAGTYQITLYSQLTNGNGGNAQTIISINPDLPPIVDFSIPETNLRDQLGTDNIYYSKLYVTDISSSADGDNLSSIKLMKKYDSDNDGSFVDENWETLFNGNYKSGFDMSFKEVGKYLLREEVTESFGQDTILQFCNGEDYKYTIKDKIVEVINIAPNTSFQLKSNKKVDVLIAVSDTYDLNTVNSKINANVKPALAAKGITDYNISTLQLSDIPLYGGNPSAFTWSDIFWFQDAYYCYGEPFCETTTIMPKVVFRRPYESTEYNAYITGIPTGFFAWQQLYFAKPYIYENFDFNNYIYKFSFMGKLSGNYNTIEVPFNIVYDYLVQPGTPYLQSNYFFDWGWGSSANMIIHLYRAPKPQGLKTITFDTGAIYSPYGMTGWNCGIKGSLKYAMLPGKQIWVDSYNLECIGGTNRRQLNVVFYNDYTKTNIAGIKKIAFCHEDGVTPSDKINGGNILIDYNDIPNAKICDIKN